MLSESLCITCLNRYGQACLSNRLCDCAAAMRKHQWESDQQVVKTAKLVVFAAVMESAGIEAACVLRKLSNWGSGLFILKLLNLEHGNLQQLGSCSEICWVVLGLEQQWPFLEFWNWMISGIWKWSALEFWAQRSFEWSIIRRNGSILLHSGISLV